MSSSDLANETFWYVLPLVPVGTWLLGFWCSKLFWIRWERRQMPTPRPFDGCRHAHIRKRILSGGEGPDDAAESWKCEDCGAYAWKYCDRTVSTWRPPFHPKLPE